MKKLNKKSVVKCIKMTRKIWGDEAVGADFRNERIAVAKESGVYWCNLLNLLDGILSSNGFNEDATDTQIFIILELLGWVVVDEEQESESL